jgi:hypothetical protein
MAKIAFASVYAFSGTQKHRPRLTKLKWFEHKYVIENFSTDFCN